jgi:argininosuccinate lyase
VICKALPFSYNLDLQEITPHLRQAIAATIDCAHIANAVLQTISINKKRLAEMSAEGFSTATELADTIARAAHVPFRTAHTIVGDLARVGAHDLDAIDQAGLRHIGKQLSLLGLTADDVAEALDINRNVARRDNAGGPAAKELKRMLKARRRRHKARQRRLLLQQTALETAETGLLTASGA